MFYYESRAYVDSYAITLDEYQRACKQYPVTMQAALMQSFLTLMQSFVSVGLREEKDLK
jgi:hypothetical protein